MFELSHEDISALQKGLPPASDQLIRHLCIKHEWLDLMQDYCLDQVIAQGGSKVKILHGSPATGKSHFLHFLKAQASASGYFVLYLNLMELPFFLSDPVQLYKAVAEQFGTAALAHTLSRQILSELGHSFQDFESYAGNLTEFICEQENAIPHDAKRLIRIAINNVVNRIGVDFSFRKFLHIFSEAVVEKDALTQDLASTWLRGEKIVHSSKVQSSLYEILNKSNARIWLYSLTELILLSGYKGVVILLDQIEAILPRSGSQMRYTPMRRNDVYELLRQLIDDLDFFHHTLFLIAGDDEILDSERYGLQSYHALWMRIQPGFYQHESLNPYADLIDANEILAEATQNGEITKLSDKLQELSDSVPEGHPQDLYMLDETFTNFRFLLQSKLKRNPGEVATDEQD
ncbi:MAG: ATP-binding protein [Candidatus Cloacimonetes bacterium]|jgi:hypothetical protein|nr:ATP-binding protein [Candidatus Cloacimonadota bacterium]MCB5287426.1 ATP-binding protein [Candidatus Cloacimonadota bacterium]MCK9184212.1 ATP-binding protein [Candidatus Cloacimonadota bacterium]MCK9583654.1 ATP-binding protein [Candidatus Cloacimonadota bacterium]MDY0229747.1 DUF2791 family P-loop domain-containing protein [Candidatus Cloacimonadaceae bacterium]